MYLIMDFIPNHTSDRHDWFVKSCESSNNEYSDYYIWYPSNDELKPPNNWVIYSLILYYYQIMLNILVGINT